ncbi:MAG: DUF5696 domain-containing protein [Defluviitaleaceae bacterium]|nr:DUF5696 domain-containing protein [Defluviitaleaceae bacterium]
MKRFLPLAAVLVMMFLLGGCAMRERYGGEVRIFGGQANVPPVVYIQNEFLRLEFLTETAEIVLTDRATGDYWRSTPEGAATCTQSAAIERFNKQSLFILDFENRHGVGQPFDTYRFSVQTGRFEHEIINNMLELRFTVGDIQETFQVPDAIYQERLHPLMEDMTRPEQLQIRNAYRAVNLNSLRSGETASDWTDRFPTMADGHTIYVLNDNVQDFMLDRIQNSLRDAGYTYEDWVADMAYFNVQRALEQAAFNVIMRFELDQNSMILTVPLTEMTYIPQFKPTQITIMPYFVVGRAEDEGYLFVPDGSGAIMFFDSARYNQAPFSSRVFGWDEAIIRDHLIHDNRAAYPVFGAYRNGSTIAAIIEEGASYSIVRAEVAGIRSPYSRVHPLFRLIHATPLDVAGRTNESLLMHEWELAQEDIVIRYVVAEGDGYVGMAHAYRDFLQVRYPWLNNRVDEPIHAMVEILGAALTPQHILGFPVDRPYPLTTYAQAADMMQTLYDFGWENVHVKMRGAHNDSIDHIVPTSLSLISQLGGRRGFDDMVNTANRLGYTFYLEGDFLRMRGTEAFDGFSPMRDAARQANRERVEHSGFSSTYFGQLGTGATLADTMILARPEFTIQTASNFVGEAASRGVNNMAFRCMASALAGDFNEDRHVTREASMNMRVDFLAGLRENDTNVWLNYGFSYGAPFADVITNMPLTDQGFGITCISVPFYQIALHGLVPFAGRPVNLAEDHSYHFLKSVESGASLFFSFMYIPTADLQVTRYRRYFANEFGRWAEIANEMHSSYVDNFGHLYNQLIVDHQILRRDGVTVTVYEDGTRIYVNTTMTDFTAPTGVFVPARPATPYVVVR